MPEIAKISNFNISEILNELLRHKNLTVSEFARRIKVPQPTIQRIVSGLHVRPHKKTLESIATYFELSIDQIAGLEPITWLAQAKTKEHIRMIPILDCKEVIQWPKIPTTNLAHIGLDINSSEKTFATRMLDGSMEPIIPKNSILIVDPEKTQGYRSFVVIQPKDFDEIVVRQMIKDGNTCYIRAVGVDFNNINMSLLNQHDKVLGVVVEVRMQLES